MSFRLVIIIKKFIVIILNSIVMKKNNLTFLTFLFCFLIALSVNAQTIIVQDNFVATGNQQYFNNTAPATDNLPGGVWTKGSGYSWSDPYIEPTWGDRPGTCYMGENMTVLGVSIASAGSYVKPKKIKISAKICVITAQDAAGGAVALGFYSEIPVKNIDQNGWVDNWSLNFNGLRVCEDGSISIYENGVKGATVQSSIALNRNQFYTFSYEIDTQNGQLSSITIEGNTAALSFTTSAFTDAGTMKAAFVTCGGQNNRGAMDDFVVSAINGPSTGVDQPKNNTSICFPNPARDVVKFVEKQETVQLYMLNGKLLMSDKNVSELNVNTIPAGMYIISSTDKSGKLRNSKIEICK